MAFVFPCLRRNTYVYVKIELLLLKVAMKVRSIRIFLFLKFSIKIPLARKDPCTPHNPCRNGRCISNDRGGFQCKCRTGWTGRRCDQGKKIFLLKHFNRSIFIF